MLLLPGMDHPT